MAIVNMNLARSQQQVENYVNLNSVVATGVTSLLQVMPYNALFTGANVAAFGISGSPIWTLFAQRYTSSGLTSIPLSATLAPTALGTSGAVGFSLAAPGITLLAGDALMLSTGGANSAVATAALCITAKALADIKTFQNTVV